MQRRAGSGRPTMTRYTTILLLGIAITSQAGCLTKPELIRPPKPALTIIARDDGGFCLNRADSIKLGLYLQALEAIYD